MSKVQEKALHIILELMNDNITEEFNYSFPKIVTGLDIGKFTKQPCDNLEGVDFEYVNQNGDGDYGFYGQIAYKLFEDIFLVFDYSD